MAFQSVPETVEIAVLGTVNSQPVQNTFHARKVGGYSEADLENLADYIDATVVSYLLPYISNQVSYDGVEIRGLDSIVDLTGNNGDGAGNGAIVNSPMPNNVSFCVKKLSGFTGRSARGRVYIWGIPANYAGTNEDYIQTAVAEYYRTYVDEVRQVIDLAGWVPVIVSRYSNGALREEGVTYEWTTSAITDLRLDSRRDRMPSQ